MAEKAKKRMLGTPLEGTQAFFMQEALHMLSDMSGFSHIGTIGTEQKRKGIDI